MTSTRTRAGGLAVVVATACLVAPACKKEPAVDLSYVLQPSAWRGFMLFDGQSYPFRLVIEVVDAGRVDGRMVWENGAVVIRVQGTSQGNHLQLTETEVLKGPAQHLRTQDSKDIYFAGDSFTGTDKAGRARLRATRDEAPKSLIAEVEPAMGNPQGSPDDIPWPPGAHAPGNIALGCPAGSRQGNPLQNLDTPPEQLAAIEKNMGEHRCCLSPGDGHVAGRCYRRHPPQLGGGIQEHAEYLGPVPVGFFVSWHPNGVMQHRGRHDSQGRRMPGWQEWNDQGQPVSTPAP